MNRLPATFFFVGRWAEDNPEIVKRVAKNPLFEVGSHSFWHEDMVLKDDNEFFADVLASKVLLERLCGREIVRFRAPSFSIKVEQYSLLTKAGYKIDSSATNAFRLYGGGRDDRQFEGLESVVFRGANVLGKNYTVLGGGYLRVLPLGLLKLISKTYIGNMVYLHPVDLPNKIERFGELNCWENFRKLARNGDMFRKLDYLRKIISSKLYNACH